MSEYLTEHRVEWPQERPVSEARRHFYPDEVAAHGLPEWAEGTDMVGDVTVAEWRERDS